jgi:hypothetical protein
MWFDKQKK